MIECCSCGSRFRAKLGDISEECAACYVDPYEELREINRQGVERAKKLWEARKAKTQ